jgi:glutaredoxin
MIKVRIYSRSNCHLCDVALETLESFHSEFTFVIEKILIDDNLELESKYGESIPVILINDAPHDFFRVNPDRFRSAMSNLA